MLQLRTRADLEKLVEEGLQESLTLEYKASLALQKSSDARSELVKDVTALANSAGGQIIYGIRERNGVPQGVDVGVDAKTFSSEWIGQVLETNSSPRVQGIQIEKISLDTDDSMKVAYVLSVPAATTFAPHQNSIDMKYYRRFESRSVPMHDYEIRDVLRRARAPELAARFAFADGGKTKVVENPADLIEIETIMENLSPEPALYSMFDFYFDKKLILVETAGFKQMSNLVLDHFELYRLQRLFITPPDFPLLRGSSVTVGPPRIGVRIPRKYFEKMEHFLIGYSASTVGFNRMRFAAIFLNGSTLNISDFLETDDPSSVDKEAGMDASQASSGGSHSK